MAGDDCDCITHDGPHWLHVAAYNRAHNLRLLEENNIRGFIVEEAARLKDLVREMRQRGCEQLPDDAESEQTRAVLRHLMRIEADEHIDVWQRRYAREALIAELTRLELAVVMR